MRIKPVQVYKNKGNKKSAGTKIPELYSIKKRDRTSCASPYILIPKQLQLVHVQRELWSQVGCFILMNNILFSQFSQHRDNLGKQLRCSLFLCHWPQFLQGITRCLCIITIMQSSFLRLPDPFFWWFVVCHLAITKINSTSCSPYENRTRVTRMKILRPNP